MSRRPTHLLAVLLVAAAPICALAGCAPITIPPCYADDLIFGEDADDESVAELAIVDCVTGNIFVENTVVGALELPYLEQVGGALIVSQNLVLSRIDLPVLVEIGGLLEVTLNSALEELTLPALTSVGDDLVVTQNPELPLSAVRDTLADVEVGGERVIE